MATSSYAWNNWSSTTYSAGPSFTTTTVDPWPKWTTTSASYSPTSNNYVWHVWTDYDMYAENIQVADSTSGYTWKTWIDIDVVQGNSRAMEELSRRSGAPLPSAKKSRRQELIEQNQQIIDGENSMYKMSESYRKKEAAELKAEDLLMDVIGEDQREVYQRTGRLLVKGKKHDYLLTKRDDCVKVQRLMKDKVIDLCIHFRDRYKYPDDDHVLALALFAKADEKGFNEKANDQGSHDRDNGDCLSECAVM